MLLLAAVQISHSIKTTTGESPRSGDRWTLVQVDSL